MPHADVAELADALDSGSSDSNVVEVQLLSSALMKMASQSNLIARPFFVADHRGLFGSFILLARDCFGRSAIFAATQGFVHCQINIIRNMTVLPSQNAMLKPLR